MYNFSPDIILNELLSFYTQEALCKQMNISIPTLKSLFANNASQQTLFKLFGAWGTHVRKNLKSAKLVDVMALAKAGKTLLVDTPDNPQHITRFFVKQPRQLIRLTTQNHKLTCSTDHLIETDNGWIYARDAAGANVLTTSGYECANATLIDRTEEVYDFEVEHHNHRYWAGTGISSHNSGKSFIASNVALHAQKAGYHVLYIDSEHAIDVEYLAKIGVDVSDDGLTYVSVTTIEDVNRVLSTFFSDYIKQYGKDNYADDVPRILIVLDSLAMLSSSTEMENYEKDGTIKADQGILAKRRKSMLRMAVGHVGRLPMAMVCTDHVYPQDIMLGDGAWAITNSTKFSSSIIGLITKLKLKDEGEVTGVRMRFETYKSRFAKLGSKVELEVPYNKGMASTSGLLAVLEDLGVIVKGTQPGEKLMWVSEVNGEAIKFKERDFSDEIAQKLIKHPNCAPFVARNEPEVVLDDGEED